jgi:hypothetical protein
MGTYQIADRGDLRKYRTEIPNIVDDLDLSVYAFRLYVHLKRVAGDSGKCWQSTDTLAKSCKISNGMISKAKDELVEKRLIEITEEKLQRGGRAAHHITIVDIWLENFVKYSGRQQEEASSYSELPSSPHELPSSQSEQASSQGEIKKEPLLTNNPNKKEKNSGDKSPAPAKPKKSSDERLNHPAIIAYREETRLHVPIAWRDEVIANITNPALWKKVVHDWIGRGWNKQNVRGMIDAYKSGGLNDTRGKPQPPVKMKLIYDARGKAEEVPA